MKNFKIAVAQTTSVKGDVLENIRRHIEVIKVAVHHQVSLIVFPELSLTDYEPELAGALKFTESDNRLTPLINAASADDIWILAGAPLESEGKLTIGSIILNPERQVSSYVKMYLRPGEDSVFVAGKTPRN